MRCKLPLLLLCLALGAGLGVRAQDRRQDDGLALDLSQTAPGPYTVHEWGVWRLRAGQVDHLADLMRESPPFVHRVATTATPPVTAPHLEIALKPVLFVYADIPLDLEITVGMPGGQPWLYFPDGIAGITPGTPGTRTVRWNVHALPPTTALPNGTSFPASSPGHWWSSLRAVGASSLIPTGTHTAERFLFYDGPIPFTPLWTPRGTTVVATGATTASPTAWVLDGHGAASRVHLGRGRHARTTRLADVAAARTELRDALIAARLTPGEVDALLTTWDHDLFQGTDARAIWLVPQGEYDRMLPLDLTPRPRDLVRVGVAIQLL